MKIGVIGLLSDQANRIADRFPDMDITFLSREREREAAQFQQQVAKVVLMTKFISHPTQHAIPNHKRVLVDGGQTALAKCLEKLKNAVEVPVKEPIKMPEPIVVQQPNPDKIDYRAIKDAHPQDVLRFPRPKGIDLTRWQSQITTIRSYYRREHDIETKPEFFPDYVELRVLRVRGKTKRPEPAPAPVASPVVPAVATAPRQDESLATFWQSVFVARLNPALPLEQAAADADAAILLFRSRFPA